MTNFRDIRSKLMERKQIKAAYARVFDTPDGKTVLKHLMREGFVTRSTFVAGDSEQTCLNEGSRRLVLSIIRMVYRDDTAAEEIEKGMQDE